MPHPDLGCTVQNHLFRGRPSLPGRTTAGLVTGPYRCPCPGRFAMPVLDALVAALRLSTIDVIDLTAPLNAETPLIRLPEPFGNTIPLSLQEISRYDDRGPAWYWNNISTGEHTGTHFDAPIPWVTGRDGLDVAQVPASQLIAPAVVLDFSAEAAADPDFLL